MTINLGMNSMEQTYNLENYYQVNPGHKSVLLSAYYPINKKEKYHPGQ
jgi:hypothetical protein